MNSLVLDPVLIEGWQKTLAHLTRNTPFLSIIHRHEQTVEHLWEIFNNQRDELTPKLLNTREAITAYLLGFHLPNTARALGLLESAFERDPAGFYPLRQATELDIIDLGCGTGAMGQAALFFLDKKGLLPEKTTVHLYDPIKLLLDTASFGLKAIKPDQSIQICRTTLESLKASFFKNTRPKVILLGYVYNEISRNQKALAFLSDLFQKLAKESAPVYLVFGEPAKKHPSRNLSRLRDYLYEQSYRPLYPCPASVEVCPLSQSGRDWCFSELDWRVPQLQRKVDEHTGMKRGGLTVSGMVFFLGNRESSAESNIPVVIGRPKEEDGSFTYLLCTGTGIDKIKPTSKVPIRRCQQFKGQDQHVKAKKNGDL
jgi:hypothetical protein